MVDRFFTAPVRMLMYVLGFSVAPVTAWDFPATGLSFLAVSILAIVALVFMGFYLNLGKNDDETHDGKG